MSDQLYGIPKVGGDVLAWCTKCKMELAHVIVSMIDTKPAKVVCKTCKGQHNYKRLGAAPTPRAKAAGGAKKAATPRTAVRAADYWQEKMSGTSEANAVPYSPKTAFKKGDVVQHTQFGLGLVEELRSGKMVVVFREGEKVLVQGLSA